MPARLPSPPRISDKNLEQYLNQLVQAIERALKQLDTEAFHKDRIRVTNNTRTYAFDASADTLATTRFILGTLLEQLQDVGKLP